MNKKNKNLLIAIIGVLLVLVIGGTVYLGTVNNEPKNTPTPTQETITKDYSKEIEEYDNNYAINSDYVGMIRFESGMINLPFVQAHDNDIAKAYDKYLRTAWDTMEHDEEGSIFLDPSNSLEDQNLVIYGHYVYPSYDITRTHKFTRLHELKDKDEYEENKYIELVLENEIRRFEVAHVYYAELDLNNPSQPLEEGMEYMFTNFTDEGLKYYFDRVSEVEFYETGVEITPEDKFLTLQTCVENRDDLRLIIVAKQVEVEKTR